MNIGELSKLSLSPLKHGNAPRGRTVDCFNPIGVLVFAGALISATPSMACLTDRSLGGQIDENFAPSTDVTAFVGIIERIEPPGPADRLEISRMVRADWETQFGGRAPERFRVLPHLPFAYAIRTTKVLSGEVPHHVLVEVGPCVGVDKWIGDEIRLKGKFVDGIFVSN